MQRHRWLWVMVITAAGLSGCGAGTTVQVAGDDGGSGRAIPLVGYYGGALLNFGVRNAIDFYLQRDGSATATIRLLDTGQRIELVGQVSRDRILRLSNADLYLDGIFSGAWNPNSPGEYVRDGVLFFGTWALVSGGTGRVECAHQSWPPPPSYSGGNTIDTSWDDPYEDEPYDPYPSGGTSGGYDGPVDGGFNSGTPDTSSPPSTGGEPTNDDIVYRRPVELDWR